MMYLDGAATTRPTELAIECFNKVSRDLWGNPSSSVYDLGIDAKRILEESREIVAGLLSTTPDKIFFCSGSTEAANWIMKGFTSRHEDASLAVSAIEHPCVYNTAEYLNDRGLAYLYKINVDHDGEIDMDGLSECLELMPTIMLVCVMDSNNEIGTIQDTAEISRLVHTYPNTYLFSDMTQSFAHLPNIDVERLGVDFTCGSGQKFGAFKGTGFLYAKDINLIDPLLHGGHQESGYRAGTENVAAIYAMAKQFEAARAEVSKTMTKLVRLKSEIVQRLDGEFWVNGGCSTLPNLLSITMPGVDANSLITLLNNMWIYLSAGSACSTGENKSSRILKAIGLSDSDARSTIRISLDVNMDVDEFCAAVNMMRQFARGR